MTREEALDAVASFVRDLRRAALEEAAEELDRRARYAPLKSASEEAAECAAAIRALAKGGDGA